MGADFPLEALLFDDLHKQTDDCSVDTQCTEWAKSCPDVTITSAIAPLMQWRLADILWKGRQVGLGTGARLWGGSVWSFLMLLKLFKILQKLWKHIFTYICLHAFACDGGHGSIWEGEEYDLFSFLLH